MQNIPIHLRSSTLRQIGLIINVIGLDGDDVVVCVGFEEAEEIGELFETEVWFLAFVAVVHCLLYVKKIQFKQYPSINVPNKLEHSKRRI